MTRALPRATLESALGAIDKALADDRADRLLLPLDTYTDLIRASAQLHAFLNHGAQAPSPAKESHATH